MCKEPQLFVFVFVFIKLIVSVYPGFRKGTTAGKIQRTGGSISKISLSLIWSEPWLVAVGWAPLGLRTRESTCGFFNGLYFSHHGGHVLARQYERGFMERASSRWPWQAHNVNSVALFTPGIHKTAQI